MQERREQEQEQEQCGRRHQARELRPAAGGVVNRRARLARSDLKALKETGRQIRSRERAELVLRLDVVPVLVRERPREKDPFGKGQQRDADRSGKKIAQVRA